MTLLFWLESQVPGQPGKTQNKNKRSEWSEIAHWVKILAAKSDNLGLILRIYKAEGENQLLKVVLRLPHMC